MQGYLHPFYAQSFSEIGEPIFLPKSRGWLIKRKIPGTQYYDAMGPYPLFFCENWDDLTDDLENLKGQIISVSFVINPFPINLNDNFKYYFDVYYAYKDHYILDLSIPLNQSISKSRRKDARRALRNISIEIKSTQEIDVYEWEELYRNLIDRHNIKGIRSFSHESFRKQLSIPDIYYFRGLNKGEIVGGNLFIIQNNVAYYHLSAQIDIGYKLDTSYAIMWSAIEFLSEKVKWLNLGGTTNFSSNEKSGLDQFKNGWSSGTAPSFFCGKILNKNLYIELLKSKNLTDNAWFPVYRKNEF